MKTECRFNKYISPYIDGELSAEEADRFCRHINSCLPCRREFKLLSSLDSQLYRMPEIDASSDFDARLLEKIDSMELRGRTATRKQWFPLWRPAMAVAAGFLILVGTFLHTNSPAEKELSPDEILISQHLELLEEYEIIRHLDLLENWPDIMENSGAEDA